MRGVREIVHDYLVHRGDAGPAGREGMILELESLLEEAYGRGVRDQDQALRERLSERLLAEAGSGDWEGQVSDGFSATMLQIVTEVEAK